ncbi:DUF1642 domain-containing protein [Lacticaseibacillus paracasei]|uniref:DUF1642 domain-containing protein n=1 Tax=Lacticaseibacillus paracasei TaxID=1597 RepID=UPI0025A1F4FD|nr:DUF1642 domain-containing protein [Lacticaseibacillus paracasei]MDM7530289.1 DUF1642 domain-containing protein [Lacticaseibacillus paracasei]MDM7542385.1 DUF1642 domain-containing protein [Lacticaseibacillus paracasei]
MSEEKLYAVKDDEGEWADQYRLFGPGAWATPDKDEREKVAKHHGGHVVTFVEEPKKVVLSEKQAEIVENAHGCDYPATSISGDAGENGNSDDEELLMNAYVNGYTVAKEKKYLVFKELDGKQKNKLFAQAYRSSIYSGTISWILTNEVKSGSWAWFTESEIEHYGLQDCEKEEVTDDGMGC